MDQILSLIQTVRKYRKQFPFIKVYVCCDPADWEASDVEKIEGKIRVQLSLNNHISSRIYEETIKPISDATIVNAVNKMYKEAVENYVNNLKEKIKENEKEAERTRLVVTEINADNVELQKEINELLTVI